jgi:V8-like Glu-specific endopeptidase
MKGHGMAWDRNTSNLRDVLAGLYWDRNDTVRFLREVHISPAYVRLSDKMVNTWTSIVEYAMNQEMLDELLVHARKEFPKDKLLILAEERRLLAVETPAIDDAAWQGATDAAELEVLTKGIDTFRPIAFLEAGVKIAKSVGRVVLANGESGSGFLIKHNLLITNHHVLPSPEVAATAQVEFNYQKTVDGLDAKVHSYPLKPEEVFKTSLREVEGGDDWTVVCIAGDANAEWGELELKPAKPQKKDEVVIIQHPGGGPKQIALSHNIVAYADERRLQYLTDTQKGSSGSPVFDLNWQVVALHHAGGSIREPGTKQSYYRNQGIHINVVIQGLLEAGVL